MLMLVFLGAMAAIIVFSILLSKKNDGAAPFSQPVAATLMVAPPAPTPAPESQKSQQWLVGKHWLVHQNDLDQAFSRDQTVYFWAKKDVRAPFELRMSINRHPEGGELGPNVDLHTQKSIKDNTFAVDQVIGLKSVNMRHPLRPGIKKSIVVSLKSADGKWVMTENENGNLVVTREGKLHLLITKSKSPEMGVLGPKAESIGKHMFVFTADFHSAQDSNPENAVVAGFLESKSDGLFINRRLFLGNKGGLFTFVGVTSTTLSGRKNTEIVENAVHRSLLTDVSHKNIF